MNGLAWYRFSILLPAGNEPYSHRLPQIRTAYQLFIDGRLMLTAGRMPPHALIYTTALLVIALPNSSHFAPVMMHFSAARLA